MPVTGSGINPCDSTFLASENMNRAGNSTVNFVDRKVLLNQATKGELERIEANLRGELNGRAGFSAMSTGGKRVQALEHLNSLRVLLASLDGESSGKGADGLTDC
ncbi:hypothetical protein JAO10_21250 [Burkholderia contaminans]|uniref:hypothetical protein n=1 Tax=Burkholderia contaminans TaxID=488447 RepID=UPI0018DCFA5B|nr:hypothetical protein [Burkholderia contaminans]MBH9722857.1 hypothetical protein [Burkholderia contaminans]